MKCFPIEIDLFDVEVLVCVGGEITEVKENIHKLCKEGYTEPSPEFMECLQGPSNEHGKAIIDRNSLWSLLWLRYKPTTPYKYGLLAHEALHITHGILERAGVTWDVENDEVPSYMVGKIVEKTLGVLRDSK